MGLKMRSLKNIYLLISILTLYIQFKFCFQPSNKKYLVFADILHNRTVKS